MSPFVFACGASGGVGKNSMDGKRDVRFTLLITQAPFQSKKESEKAATGSAALG